MPGVKAINGVDYLLLENGGQLPVYGQAGRRLYPDVELSNVPVPELSVSLDALRGIDPQCGNVIRDLLQQGNGFTNRDIDPSSVKVFINSASSGVNPVRIHSARDLATGKWQLR